MAEPPSLQRNQACASCRRRRIKCDARRPICGPCETSSRADDCEYLDNQSRSKADILEEDISRLEDRIYELEHPAAATSETVYLYDPYRQPQRRSQTPSLPQALHSSGPPSPEPASIVDSWWNSPEPPRNMVENFLDTFIPYASDWGFFLDISRFRREVLLSYPIGHHSRPTPPLLTAVYLIGLSLSDSAALKMHEKEFLSRALTSLPVSLSGLHPRKAIHALQTEILLSNYFYASGRFLEGRYHTTAAASLALSGGLFNVDRSAPSLIADTDTSEDADRIDACWATIILDKSWAVALATFPNLPDSAEMLAMPWPDDATASSSTPSTVSQYLESTETPTAILSPKTLLAKAVVLWERANSLVIRWNQDMTQGQAQQFSDSFAKIDSQIDDLFSQADSASNSANVHRLVLAGLSIAHAAIVQLHGTFAQTKPESKKKCLAAAKAILELTMEVDPHDSRFINPILSVRALPKTSELLPTHLLQMVWVAACEIFIDEIAVLRAARPAWAHDTPSSAEAAFVDVFDRAFAVMSRFGSWQLMKTHLGKVEKAYSAV
ncbi:hypothetical protein B0H16DRAFT_268000 [Mycena metata]|uniref:Zn(2)-C6 fungal-type domain-containing protein n=1 Tax=Mycena metata TaxID=1033252 RepID=A0AAD7MQF1_9AGAR|nr:hypothetical protein B0H16DRAFT_268000 [Mycena metata]